MKVLDVAVPSPNITSSPDKLWIMVGILGLLLIGSIVLYMIMKKKRGK